MAPRDVADAANHAAVEAWLAGERTPALADAVMGVLAGAVDDEIPVALFHLLNAQVLEWMAEREEAGINRFAGMQVRLIGDGIDEVVTLPDDEPADEARPTAWLLRREASFSRDLYMRKLVRTPVHGRAPRRAGQVRARRSRRVRTSRSSHGPPGRSTDDDPHEPDLARADWRLR